MESCLSLQMSSKSTLILDSVGCFKPTLCSHLSGLAKLPLLPTEDSTPCQGGCSSNLQDADPANPFPQMSRLQHQLSSSAIGKWKNPSWGNEHSCSSIRGNANTSCVLIYVLDLPIWSLLMDPWKGINITSASTYTVIVQIYIHRLQTELWQFVNSICVSRITAIAWFVCGSHTCPWQKTSSGNILQSWARFKLLIKLWFPCAFGTACLFVLTLTSYVKFNEDGYRWPFTVWWLLVILPHSPCNHVRAEILPSGSKVKQIVFTLTPASDC